MTVKVYDVIEVARTRAFAQGAELFSEGLVVSIATGPKAAFRAISVGVKYLAVDGG